MTDVLKRRGGDARDVCAQRKDLVRTHKKAAIFKPGSEASRETTPAGTLILDFRNCGEVNFCCLGSPGCAILLWQPWMTNTPP